MNPTDAYDELIRRTREESLLASCIGVLGWDELTYLPRGGVAYRGEQLAYLSGLLHEKGTDPRLGELLGTVEGSPLVADPDAVEAANVREIRRVYDRQVRVPRRLVEEIARATSTAQQEWAVARQDDDFARFRPWLEKVVRLRREEAQAARPGFSPYDALLDEYEPGATAAELTGLFAALRQDLVPLAQAIAGARRQPDTTILCRDFPVDRQRTLSEVVAAAVGFDFHRGRLDTTVHPFCSSQGPDDCRIATRYRSDSFGDGFFATLHEVGHALYELGVDSAHQGTPVGETGSLGLHESQARLWENTVGRSRAFWSHSFPLARRIFHEALGDIEADEFHFAVNAVQPSLNRVQADEVTYNLHVLIRFELEQALVSENLRAVDVPGAWGELYRRHLGLSPGTDAEGCLQDGHWGAGLIGYFPTYTLGNVYAAQLMARAEQDLGELDSAFARGDFAGLLGWLRDRVHRHGNRWAASRLIEKATGAAPDHFPLVEALRQKYTRLYGI